ncbi:MAG: hypothetical protein LQ341_001543 [Variospora aurantia]|nr:MAG: hypothetical protein LQ341_001543 [Variospora aurantia]
MSLQNSQPSQAAAQQPYLQVSAQPLTSISNTPVPQDNFSYDFGPSETPTRPREGDAKSFDESKISADSENPLDPDQLHRQLDDIIFEKPITSTRAKIPPGAKHTGGVRQVDGANAVGKLGAGSQPVQPATNGKEHKASQLGVPSSAADKESSVASLPAKSGTGGKKHKNSLVGVQYGATSAAGNKTTLRRIMLDWGNDQGQESDAQQYVLKATVEGPDARVQSQNAVMWQHSDLQGVELDELNNLVARMKNGGLEENLVGLSKRLLNRVRRVTQREFVNGSFLTPKVMRYDMHDASSYGHNKCCMFISFPYFAVNEAQERRAFNKGDPRHPVRTLLQSRYRLNETIDKDESQCIRTVGTAALKSCIHNASKHDVDRLDRTAHTELIYVPQMWALVMGLDHMLTAGPISCDALLTSAIVLNENSQANKVHGCTFVRISFMNDDMHEEVTYPRDQCASWFGLLNKHHEIRSVLPQGKRGSTSNSYPLLVGDHVLSNVTWASIQRTSSEPVLKLWMETPKLPELNVRDVDSSPEGQHINDVEEDVSEQPKSMASNADARFEELGHVPVVKAFLAWRVMDDYGDINDCPVEVQTQRFLDHIYGLLAAKCVDDPQISGALPAQSGPFPDAKRNPRPKLDIHGKTLEDVRAMLSRSRPPEAEKSIRKKTLVEYEELFKYFIPNEQDQRSAPVRLFWGALYALLKQNPPFLGSLLAKTQAIKSCACLLHLGVHFERYKDSPSEQAEYEDEISTSAILEESMVSALRTIFSLLIEAVREAGLASSSTLGDVLPDRVARYGNEACQLLTKARDQLIAEATGTIPERDVGAVVTPEVIFIKFIERLARGVYGSGTVDVINILEECLEQLALRVEKHSSRRLLQKLNAFEEEVDIISEVLRQQINVLVQLRHCLDPDKFEPPTIARKMRFKFEKQGIERILCHIEEQLKYCRELRERAKVLAVQNVQLVETLADDNSRAIFVFTFITVLFLPLSFVAGFFGMNLAGIADSTSTVSHFWYIAVPFTVGILVMCAIFVAWGETIWFAAIDFPERCKQMVKRALKGGKA